MVTTAISGNASDMGWDGTAVPAADPVRVAELTPDEIMAYIAKQVESMKANDEARQTVEEIRKRMEESTRAYRKARVAASIPEPSDWHDHAGRHRPRGRRRGCKGLCCRRQRRFRTCREDPPAGDLGYCRQSPVVRRCLRGYPPHTVVDPARTQRQDRADPGSDRRAAQRD